MIQDDAIELFLKPSKTKNPISDPTAFPTVVPNKPILQIAHVTGERTLWVVFALMLIATISFAVMSWTVPASKRLYHSLTTLIVLIATLSYFAMATGSGYTLRHYRIREKHDHGLPDTFRHVHREVYWARYVDWLLTTPLLLVDLGLLAGLNGANLFSIVVADIIMILGGLFAALNPTTPRTDESLGFRAPAHGAKWGWYTIACIAFLWIIYSLLVTGLSTARVKSKAVSNFYTMIAGYTLIIWLAYPIIWAVADGTRHLSVDGEIIAYAVLDVLAKGVFGAWLLFTHKRMPDTDITLDGFWSRGFNSEGRIRIGEDDQGA